VFGGGLRKGGSSRTSPAFGGGEGALRCDFEGGWQAQWAIFGEGEKARW
jgi:hypothetical protein